MVVTTGAGAGEDGMSCLCFVLGPTRRAAGAGWLVGRKLRKERAKRPSCARDVAALAFVTQKKNEWLGVASLVHFSGVRQHLPAAPRFL